MYTINHSPSRLDWYDWSSTSVSTASRKSRVEYYSGACYCLLLFHSCGVGGCICTHMAFVDSNTIKALFTILSHCFCDFAAFALVLASPLVERQVLSEGVERTIHAVTPPRRDAIIQ